jgi:hypothetical protein
MPYAGVFLNAVPKWEAFRMQTWALRISVQKRLGLPLLAAAAAAGEYRSRSGRVFDAYGDVAQNDGAHGHQTRHWLILEAIYDALKRAYGGMVKKEPTAYRDYSDTRPDLTLLRDGLLAMDLKVLDPVGSVAGDVPHRGGFVAFGNTREEARELVVGRAQRGAEGDGTFKRTTGGGYVAPKDGAYKKAMDKGVAVRELLVEVWGGIGDGLLELLREAAAFKGNKLSAAEYDGETTWSARTWMTFAMQRISVAVQKAVAKELSDALGFSAAVDPRGEPRA